MTALTTDHSVGELPKPTRLSEVKGWFFAIDQVLFDWFLTRQNDRDEPGDLLELGAYMGKSTIFMGARQRSGDRFTVCDLFDSPAEEYQNTREMQKSYSTLTRRAFEANYLSFHDELPTVIQGLSSVIRDHVEDRTCRFAHIDASHMYEHVHGDIQAVRELLTDQGIVVMDDYRSEHCPGVAAATWQAVTSGDLRPICVSGTKFYGTWGDPEPVQRDLVAWLEGREDIWHDVTPVAGRPLVRLKGRGKGVQEPAHPVSRHHVAVPAQTPTPAASAPAAASAPQPPAGRSRSPLRRLAVNVLPPFITKAVVAARRSGGKQERRVS